MRRCFLVITLPAGRALFLSPLPFSVRSYRPGSPKYHLLPLRQLCCGFSASALLPLPLFFCCGGTFLCAAFLSAAAFRRPSAFLSCCRFLCCRFLIRLRPFRHQPLSSRLLPGTFSSFGCRFLSLARLPAASAASAFFFNATAYYRLFCLRLRLRSDLAIAFFLRVCRRFLRFQPIPLALASTLRPSL